MSGAHDKVLGHPQADRARLRLRRRRVVAIGAAGLIVAVGIVVLGAAAVGGPRALAQVSVAPQIDSGPSFSVEEGTAMVATLVATDTDTAAEDLEWSITAGADQSHFTLTDAGELSFAVAKDFENPDDSDSDGVYEVSVSVSDGTDSDTAAVTVTVTNVIELTTLAGPADVEHSENWAGRVATYSASSAADAAGVGWSLSGVDAARFSVDDPGGALRFSIEPTGGDLFLQLPDFDDPLDDDGDGFYEITVNAEVGGDQQTLDVEVTVADAPEPGTLVLSSTRPQLGETLTTTLTDPDGVTGTVTYLWERSVGRGTWAALADTAASHLPTAADSGHFLRVTATYQDSHGSANTAAARTSEVVTADLLSALAVSTTDSAANPGHALRPSFDSGTLHYSIGCAASDTMTLTATAGSGVRLSINGTQVTSGESHTEAVEADGEVRVALAAASGAATTYFVRCLSGDLLDMTATTAAGATGVIEDLIMFGVAKETERSVAIVDSNGAVRFHRMDANWGGGYVRAAWVSAAGEYRYAYYKRGAGQHWQILDQNLEFIDNVGTVAPLTGTNQHDMTLLDDGNYLLMAYEPVERDLSELTFGTFGTSVRMRDAALQIRTPGGTPLLTWSSHDAIPFEDCKPKFPPGQAEYAHVNTLQMVDGHIVASFRGCNTVLRIDPDDASSHKVVWRLGLTNLSDEQWDGLGKGPAPLEIIGDAEGQFCGQHGSSLLPNGHLILFDNGALCMQDPWLDTQLLARPGGEYSRAVEYALDVDNGEAVFLRDHSLGGARRKTARVHGHVEKLEGGDWLIGWGEGGPRKPTVSVTQADPDTGEEKFWIVLRQADGSSESIRPTLLTPVALADVLAPLGARIVTGAHTSTAHEGAADRPTVAVAFNRPVVDFAAATSSVSVAGGSVEGVAALVESGAPAHAYVFTLVPDGDADIGFGLVAGQGCDSDPAGVCTADNTTLSVVPAAAHTIVYMDTIVSMELNTQPAFGAGETGARSVAENTAPGANIGAAVAADDDDGDTLAYSLTGADAAAFDLDVASGQLSTKAPLDHETKDSYGFTLSVSDNKDANGDADDVIDDTIDVTVTVTDVNEAPVLSEPAVPVDPLQQSFALDQVNGKSRGIWSDGTTMWVADHGGPVYAYDLAGGTRDNSKDIDTLDAAGNDHPRGLWSDGQTMWVADHRDDKIYAYDLAGGTRDNSKDIDTLDAAGNNHPRGLWSDGQTMWVADHGGPVYAYDLAGGTRDNSKDIDTLDAAGNDHPDGLWSDGETMWVADHRDDKIYAYDLAAGTHDATKDLDALDAAGNTHPRGLWSDGETMWVSDPSDDLLYAYSQWSQPSVETTSAVAARSGTFKALAAGLFHVCAIATDGTVSCWGNNGDGRGDPPAGTYKLLGAGGRYTCAIASDDTIACWGSNDIEQLAAPAGTYQTLTAGDRHACAIATDGTVSCWGYDAFGQSVPPAGTFTALDIGWEHTCAIATDGTLACWGYPPSVSPPGGTFKALTAGEVHTCAIATDDTVACWGVNYKRRGATRAPTGTYKAVDAGSYHACAINSDDTIACWGYNAFGQSDPPAGTYKTLAVDDDLSCAIKSDDTIACWGANSYGQADAPAGTYEAITVAVEQTCAIATDGTVACWGYAFLGQTEPLVGTYRSFDAGYDHTCAIKSDDTVACWGYDEHGETDGPAGTYEVLTSGYVHTCAIKSDDTIACWGWNLYGQVDAPAGTYKALDAGYDHTCAIKSDDTIACWGWNLYGQADAPAGTYKALTAGIDHTCAIKSDDTIACWGLNDAGQSDPPAGTYKTLAVNSQHTCAIATDDTVACWGLNDAGQSDPPAGTFKALTAGYNHTCAINSDDTIACWGLNDAGQSDPPAGTFKALTAGAEHTCAIATDDTVACWGLNGNRQSDPPAGTFKALSLGDAHTCAIATDDTVVCWPRLPDGVRWVS